MWPIFIKSLPDITNEPQLSVGVSLHAAVHFAQCPHVPYPFKMKKLYKLCDF